MDTLTSVVQLQSGNLAGLRSGDVCSYLGVPFAGSTAGEGRWRPPGPAPSWTGTREATAFGPEPIQPPRADRRSRAPGTSEDALSLNIWTPADTAGRPWPVMVWLEGGSFMTGGGAGERIDGAALARRGVVLVTLNYRLSVFGFLAHPLLTAESGHQASSNYGLMDQLAALRWLRENVRAFGGDPNRITVFGVSAGSASIGLLLTSPQARGLFHQAIMHSPGSLRPLASLADAERAGSVVGTDLAAMRAMSTDELLAKNASIGPKVRGLTTPRILRPILDGYVVPREESEAYADGDFMDVPLIVGSTGNEGGWAVGDLPISTVAEYRTYMGENFGDATAEALERYPVKTDADVKPQLATVFGDTQFSYGARGLARAFSRRQPQTFRYVFRQGTSGHSHDTPYVFGNPEATFDDDDRAVSDAMSGAWVQFAKSGNPNGPGLPEWPAFDEVADNYLDIRAPFGIGRHWRTEHLDFIGRYLQTKSRQP